MKIAKNTVVTVHYKLSDAQNNMLEDGQEPIVYLHGGYDDTLPALEKALDGQDIGYKTMIQVEPEDAFGEYDSALLKSGCSLKVYQIMPILLMNLPFML